MRRGLGYSAILSAYTIFILSVCANFNVPNDCDFYSPTQEECNDVHKKVGDVPQSNLFEPEKSAHGFQEIFTPSSLGESNNVH